MLMMERVLITGATGFVGRHCLAPLLSQAGEVHAVGRSVAGLTHENLHVHVADLFNPRDVSDLIRRIKPSHLLHLAWITTPGAYWESPKNLSWVEASLHLVRRFVEHGGRRAVLAGSSAEYDWSKGLCHETATPLRPASLYGACKTALHTMVDALARQNDLSTAWARLFFLYGPHEHPARLVPSVICSLLHGGTAQCRSSAQCRDFLYVADAAAALITLLGSSVGGAINIGTGEALSVRELVERIAGALSAPERVSFADPGDEKEAQTVIADVGRLHRELGWSPERDLTEGLAETIAWWKGQEHGLFAA
jgi:nucleoside-diphosphate-sugar epimerase